MKLEEIYKAAKAAKPGAFGGVDDAAGLKLVGAVLAEIGQQIRGAAEKGAGGKQAVAIKGLGRFSVKAVEKEKDGAKVQKTRVRFKVASGKGGKKKGGKKNRKGKKGQGGGESA